jgi:hypothetical protein
MANHGRARLREFHLLELIFARAARHRTMAANPIIWFGSKLAHTQTAVLDQLRKSQQNRATAFGSCQITAIFFGWARGIYRFSS